MASPFPNYINGPTYNPTLEEAAMGLTARTGSVVSDSLRAMQDSALFRFTTRELLEEVERRLVLRCDAEAGQRRVDFQWAYSHVREAMILIKE